ncbi:MAG: hypothetical protein ABII06_08490, partial [Pseudomonadota bacterium]
MMLKKPQIMGLAKWTVRILAGLVLLTGLLFGLLQTTGGKALLVRWATRSLTMGSGGRVVVGDITGLVPFHFDVDRIAVADGEGEWLEVEDFRFRLAPGPLLRGRIFVRELSSSAVHLRRRPPSGKGEGPQEKGLPAWPPSLPPVILGRLEVKEALVDEPVFGEAMAFGLTGRMRSGPDVGGVEGELRIDRKGGPETFARIDWAVTGEVPMFMLDAGGADGSGTILKKALGMKEKSPSVFHLKGEGPMSDWKGDLSAEAERIGKLRADVGWALQEKAWRLKTRGHLEVDPSLVPAGVGPLLGKPETPFSLDIQYDGARDLVINEVRVETPSVQLNLAGRVDLRDQGMKGEFRVLLPILSQLEPLTGERIEGELTAGGRLGGTLLRPEADFTVLLKTAVLGDFSSPKAEFDIAVSPAEDQGKGSPAFGVRARGRIEDLTHPYERFFSDRRIEFSLDALADTSGDVLVREFKGSSQNVAVSYAGKVEARSAALRGDGLIEIRDLNSISWIPDQDLQGTGRLQASFDFRGSEKKILADIKGRIRGSGWPSPAAAALAGGGIDFSGHMESVPESISLSGVTVRTGALEISGDGALDFKDGAARGQFLVRVPQLAVLSKPLGRQIRGALESRLRLEGPLERPKLRLTGEVRDISVEGMALQRVGFDLSAEDLRKAPKGRFNIDLDEKQGRFRTEGLFSLQNNLLDLADVNVTGPGIECKADLNIDLDRAELEGKLRGRSGDLSALPLFRKETLSGRAELKADFARGAKGQEAAFELQGRNLSTQYGDMDDVRLKGRIEDLFGTPRGDFLLAAKSLEMGDLRIENAEFSAKGGLSGGTFQGNLKGEYGEGFEIRTDGELVRSLEQESLNLIRFSGRYGDQEAVLAGPLRIRRRGEEVVLDEMMLTLGQAPFTASGALGPDRVDFKARMSDLPLKVFEIFGVPPFSGSAGLDVRMTGNPRRPQVTLDLTAKELGLRDQDLPNLPPLNLSLKAALGEGLLNADLSISGGGQDPITAGMKVPLQASLIPAAFSFPENGILEGKASAKLQLKGVPGYLQMEDQSMGGELFLTCSLSGSVKSP